MREEKEIIELTLKIANQLPEVKAVGISGSRGNPDAPVDIFQDYDIIFAVKDLKPLLKNRDWLAEFGSRLIMQTPEEMALFPASLGNRFTFLMLFEDDVRIDLMLCPIDDMDELREDPFIVPLHDPEGLFKDFPEPSDEMFWVAQPSEDEFFDCTNEFWWVTTYVVKGLWRNELFYATDHLYDVCQKELLRLLSWQVAAKHDFEISVGKNDKYLPDYLAPDQVALLNSLRDFSSRESIWTALFSTQQMFHDTAIAFAQKMGFTYDEKTADKVMDYTYKWRKDQKDMEKIDADEYTDLN